MKTISPPVLLHACSEALTNDGSGPGVSNPEQLSWNGLIYKVGVLGIAIRTAPRSLPAIRKLSRNAVRG